MNNTFFQQALIACLLTLSISFSTHAAVDISLASSMKKVLKSSDSLLTCGDISHDEETKSKENKNHGPVEHFVSHFNGTVPTNARYSNDDIADTIKTLVKNDEDIKGGWVFILIESLGSLNSSVSEDAMRDIYDSAEQIANRMLPEGVPKKIKAAVINSNMEDIKSALVNAAATSSSSSLSDLLDSIAKTEGEAAARAAKLLNK